MFPRYRYNDRVIVDNGVRKIPGTVTSISKDPTGDYICRVKFDDNKLIPSEMEYPEDMLVPMNGVRMFGNWVNSDNRCPKCGTDWHVVEHPIHGKKEIWYDCIKCKKTKEQIMDEINSEPQGSWD